MSIMAFANRILYNTPGIASSVPYASRQPFELAIDNQLLVAESVVLTVEADLKMFGINSTRLTTLLQGLPPAPLLKKLPIDDVVILELAGPPFPNPAGSGIPANATIFDVARVLRDRLGASDIRKVSPNHILVPEGPSDNCPYGPPAPLPQPPPGLPRRAANAAFPNGVPVTVIDAGYQWNPAWGIPNPLPFIPNPPPPAEKLPPVAAPGMWLNGTLDVGAWPAGAATVSPEEIQDFQGHRRLVALAGHANFIAGVIAQKSPHAAITISNFNGSFDTRTAELPLEAAVARALCVSATSDPRPLVLDIGFAFLTSSDTVSVAWDAAVAYIAQKYGPSPPPVIACPAGNHDLPYPRFPGALWKIGPQFANVVSVGSFDATGIPLAPFPPPKSCFSNFGPWVRCSAVGTNVESTFLCVDQPLEDGTPPNPQYGLLGPVSCFGAGNWPSGAQNFTPNPAPGAAANPAPGWASWNGTSFATPKVVAAIAEKLAANPALSPAQALAAVLTTGAPDPNGHLGHVLPIL